VVWKEEGADDNDTVTLVLCGLVGGRSVQVVQAVRLPGTAADPMIWMKNIAEMISFCLFTHYCRCQIPRIYAM
jgi:hypothetical protein